LPKLRQKDVDARDKRGHDGSKGYVASGIRHRERKLTRGCCLFTEPVDIHPGSRRSRPERRMRRVYLGTACAVSLLALSWAAFSDSLPPDASYRPLPTQPFSVVRAADEAQKPAVMRRQAELLQARYDLADRPMPDLIN
jgi:hypothetical protein